jgi:hypothetical protein
VTVIRKDIGVGDFTFAENAVSDGTKCRALGYSTIVDPTGVKWGTGGNVLTLLRASCRSAKYTELGAVLESMPLSVNSSAVVISAEPENPQNGGIFSPKVTYALPIWSKCNQGTSRIHS